MHDSFTHNLLLTLLPCLIPPYAIRLTRLYGIRRVGWGLVSIFSLLAGLQVVRAWPMGLGIDPAVAMDLLNFLIPGLLLVSMVHTEMLFRERLRAEQEEKKMRDRLEIEVKERTVELDRANDELQHEIMLRRQGEQELRSSKEQYRFLFDENPQPMWIYDLQTFQFLAFNTAALRHYGYSKTEFAALTAQALFAPTDLQNFIADSTKPSSALQRRVWLHLKKDGTPLEVDIVAQDLIYSGRSARLVLAHDVTAQRILQKHLLQHQKAEVTAQLAGGVADNFNRLIAGLENDADLVVKNCQDPALAEPLKRIAANAASADALTKQLLALVRRSPMRPQTLDLNKVVESQLVTAGRLLGANIKLEKSCWQNLPLVMADPALIDQIFRNLLLNARDAMPDGGSVTLSTAAVRVDEAHARQNEGARPGTYVCLTVSDTGCGMTPEVEARLFEPFFTTKGSSQAAGLGLATVHGLVKQHAGWVEVCTQPGAGSQFAVFLPCAITGWQSASPRAQQVPAAQAEQA
jgi:PAS domain S-box-containing protein